IRSLGIEPTANTAKVARDKGVPTEVTFLGEATGHDVAARHGRADLVVANNVFAHVPDIVDFAKGLRALVADHGVVSIEIPHLLRLIEHSEYDTIYHEHFSYLSVLTAQRVLAAAGLTLFDVDELPTHGGSMRLWSMPVEAEPRIRTSVARLLATEAAASLDTVEGHEGFARQVAKIRNDFVEFLVGCQRQGLRVAGYGAPGKGNTLLNHCGVRSDLIEFVVDRNPHKHGKFLPGTHIPIHPVEKLDDEQPDYVVIMPWNLRKEISTQLHHVREWGGELVVALPRLEVVDSIRAVERSAS
ncbi:MAG: methyltransferase domain-containing protein, partial [Janthinobacterium lividum]